MIKKSCKVVTEYKSAYPDPIKIKKGERLEIGKRETDWSGWAWCTNEAGKSGWVPERYIEKRKDGYMALFDYEATELTVTSGEVLTIEKEESGWLWCTNQKGHSGWVPAENVEVLSLTCEQPTENCA